MADLETFLHADLAELPVIVQAGLLHVQFESIHPFLDGNGRLGRLLVDVFAADRVQIERLGRATGTALRVHEQLQRTPAVTVREIAAILAVSQPTADTALTRLAEIGIVREVTGRRRGRRYVYSQYVDILSEGTEPIAAGR